MSNLIIRHRRQIAASYVNLAFMLPVVLGMLIFSCTVVKKHQYAAYKPFVYDVGIKVGGDLKPTGKRDLEARLNNQLDDSLRTPVVSFLGIYKTLHHPPVFDTLNLRRSVALMSALLHSSGYFAGTIRDTVTIDTVKKDQYRVSIHFRVNPGKQWRLDSIGYALQTPELEALAVQSQQQSLLQKNAPYSIQTLSAELDRLVALFRNNGYYRFSRGELVIQHDSVLAALIDPTVDPFQQAALLAALEKKRDHPTINVVLLQRPVRDPRRLAKYYIGHVTVYPDLPVPEDTATVSHIDSVTTGGLTIISRSGMFKPSLFRSNVYLRPGELYKQSNYTRTLNRFNQLGAWQQSAINMAPSKSADSVLDVFLRLYPAPKYHVSADPEVRLNTNDIVTAGNLFGVGVNLWSLNRNTFRQSVPSRSNLRGGVEFGGDFIQTTQVSFSHTISFPKLIPALPPAPSRFLGMRRDSVRSLLNFDVAYTDRRQYFILQTFNTSWGYEWVRNNRSFLFRPLNIEYTRLYKTETFRRLLDSIPSLNLAFKSGLVIGMQLVYNTTRNNGSHTDFLRISGEESGAVTGFIRSWDEGDLWRFVKGDIELRRHIDYRRTQLALRTYAGAGLAFGREGKGWEQTLPFYKAFFAGGPGSMRAWQVRQLGPGSSKFYDTLGGGKFIDRFGDIQLEGNIEYRFPIGTVFGVKLKSAVYMDAGNIWNRHQTDSARRDVGSDFTLDRFYDEIAVDAGTGLRLDFFDHFLMRFDWAYKIRDPQNLYYSDRWLNKMSLSNGQFQLGIGYPF